MLQVIDKECCVGCGACAAACSQKCIQLLYDEEGFLYPSVDSGKCVDCQRCQKVCPALKATRNKKNDLNALAFGCLYLDEYIRLKSSSGGIFSRVS